MLFVVEIAGCPGFATGLRQTNLAVLNWCRQVVIGAFKGGEVDRGFYQGTYGAGCLEGSVVAAAATAAEQGEYVAGL